MGPALLSTVTIDSRTEEKVYKTSGRSGMVGGPTRSAPIVGRDTRCVVNHSGFITTNQSLNLKAGTYSLCTTMVLATMSTTLFAVPKPGRDIEIASLAVLSAALVWLKSKMVWQSLLKSNEGAYGKETDAFMGGDR